MPKLSEIIKVIEGLAPPGLAADWDNTGLQIGDPDADISRVLVALDPVADVIAEARELGCGLVLAHHPLFFRPVKCLDISAGQGAVAGAAISAGIAVYSAHTSLDRVPDGVSGALADALGLKKTSVLVQAEGWPKGCGFGRIGALPKKMSAGSFARMAKSALGVPAVRIIGDPDLSVQRVAVCGGSGSDLAGAAIAAGADCYVTGDVKYHEALDVAASGMAVIDAGHFGTEMPVAARLAELLGKALRKKKMKTDVVVSRVQAEPWATL